MTERRVFELWIAEPLNAREFQKQRDLLDLSLQLKGALRRSVLNSITSDARVKIAKPPATQFVSMLKWLLTERAYDRVVEPLLAQEHHEYYEALRCDDVTRAYWIELRMYVLISYNVFLVLVDPIVKLFRSEY